MTPRANAFYCSLPGRVTRHITVSGVHVLCLHTTQHVAASPSPVFVLVKFQFSDGTTAECAAAPRHHMVESLLLHGYSALSTTFSQAVTSWCELHVLCAATGLHTRVQRHCVFRLRVQPTVTTQCHQLTSSGGPHSQCHRRCNTSFAC